MRKFDLLVNLKAKKKKKILHIFKRRSKCALSICEVHCKKTHISIN